MKAWKTALKLGVACMMAGAALAAGGSPAQAKVTVCPDLNGPTGDLLPWQVSYYVYPPMYITEIQTFTNSRLTSSTDTSCSYVGTINLSGNSTIEPYIPGARFTFSKTELNPNGVVTRPTDTS